MTVKRGSYIVVNEMDGGPTVLLTRPNSVWRNIPLGGALLDDIRQTTVFASRADARAAIRRTMAFWHARGRHLDWPDDAYSVRRLVAVGAR